MKSVAANKTSAASQHASTADYTKAMLNILEDMAEEKERLVETQRAMSNILEDSAQEKALLEDMQKAVLNILEDSAQEKAPLEDAQRAVLNILEDSAQEKTLMEDMQKAVLNILDDFTGEKERLEESQRAMLNILDDFGVEREKAERANNELREAFDSLRRAKETADAANRELEAFSYSVSHDLRAPLRAIDGFSLALLEDYTNLLDDQGQDYLQRVRSATQRMAQLIDDLLKLSRLTRGELNIVKVDLSGLARAVAAELQKSQPKRRVTFRIAPGLTDNGDPSMLKAAIENLLGNAWKFTGKRKMAVIEFGAAQVDGKTAFFIRDNGAGFDMAYVDKLFGTFQRLHQEKEFPGTGIGLSLVKRIVVRHGGEVWAEGAPDRGATFWFTLHQSGTDVA